MGRTAILNIKCENGSFIVEISEYSTEGGNLLSRSIFGKESEIKQIRIKNKVIFTADISSYSMSVVVEELNSVKLGDEVLLIE
ncbi:MAG: hypothetical protein QW039_05840 [Fervidicoccaceae archaeon]